MRIDATGPTIDSYGRVCFYIFPHWIKRSRPMPETTALPISDHSLDSLLDALITGNPVLTKDGAFALEIDSRVALAFYRNEKRAWSRLATLLPKEIDGLLEAMEKGAIPGRQHSPPPTTTAQRWHLRKVTAHRFAGLHRHCNPADGTAPPLFEWNVNRELSLISGFNGAGKSSLLAAIGWCLTGKSIRCHSGPDEALEPMSLELPQSEEEDEDDERTRIGLPPVVPVPTAIELAVLDDDQPITNDTWVELSFEPVDGGSPVTVRRELKRSKAGKFSTAESGLSLLGLSPLALNVGTVMPAIAARMRFDQPSEYGQAIAELTGMKPFSDFGHRINKKVTKRLRGEEVIKVEATAGELEEWFKKDLSAHHVAIESTPDLWPPQKITLPSDPSCRERLSAARTAAEKVAQDSLEQTRTLLGSTPDLRSDTVAQLRTAVEKARLCLVPGELANLRIVQSHLRPLKDIKEAELDLADQQISALLTEAEHLAERLADEETAKRWQLYARVAQWHDHHHTDLPFDRCPVCSSSLDNIPHDALLDLDIRAALTEARQAARALARTPEEWQRERRSGFLAEIPNSIKSLMERDWSGGLTPLYLRMVATELLGKPEFRSALAPLAANARQTLDNVLTAIPIWQAPEPTDLPGVFARSGGLAETIGKARTVISLARFRLQHQMAFDDVFSRVIGNANSSLPEKAGDAPLQAQLASLLAAVNGATPAAEAISRIAGLEKRVDQWDDTRKRLALLERTALALEPFTNFPAMIDSLVGQLLAGLQSDTARWVGRIYQSQQTSAPAFAGLQEDGGILDLRASVGGVVAPAHQILNTSALRAHVWGFLFALWQQIWKKRGGLSLLLLDDPQVHFDRSNAEHFASAISKMLEAKMAPILASNDKHFVAQVTDHIRMNNLDARSSFLMLSPFSQAKLFASLAPNRDEIDVRFEAWSANQDDPPASQNFVEAVRIYLETRLRDLLDSDGQIVLHPTLGPLLSRIGELKNNGQPPFAEAPFAALIGHRALNAEHPFRKAINQAHHSDRRDITPAQALTVSEHFKDVLDCLQACAETYARHMGRLPPDDSVVPSRAPEPPNSAPLSLPPLKVLPPLAARMDIHALSEASVAGDIWDWSDLGNVLLYGVYTATLGQQCRVGQSAIVSPDALIADNDLCIVLKGKDSLARRVENVQHPQGSYVLSGIPTLSPNIPKSFVIPRYQARPMKIIGVLYDQHRGIRGDCSLTQSQIIAQAKFIAPVVDHSAHPMIPDGSRVLLSPVNDSLGPDDLDMLMGTPIAVALTGLDGDLAEGCLKRMGPAFPGFPAVRSLENLGASAGTMHVHFPSAGPSPSPDIPSVRQLWRVCGTLFPSTENRRV